MVLIITVTPVERKKQKTNRLCYLFLVFLTGCLVGWVYEEIFYWITEGMLRNRGIRYFGMRLWDYRGLLWNIDGIICFRSVVSFALMGLVFHYWLEPTGLRIVQKLPPGTDRVADSPEAAARNRSNCLPGISVGIFGGLHSERTVPDTDYLLGENRLPFPSGTVGVFGNYI